MGAYKLNDHESTQKIFSGLSCLKQTHYPENTKCVSTPLTPKTPHTWIAAERMVNVSGNTKNILGSDRGHIDALPTLFPHLVFTREVEVTWGKWYAEYKGDDNKSWVLREVFTRVDYSFYRRFRVMELHRWFLMNLYEQRIYPNRKQRWEVVLLVVVFWSNFLSPWALLTGIFTWRIILADNRDTLSGWLVATAVLTSQIVRPHITGGQALFDPKVGFFFSRAKA